MKKMVVMVLLAVLALSPLYSYEATKKSAEMVAAPSFLDNSVKGDTPVLGPISGFQQGANGFGWYQGNNNKVDYDPTTDTFASAYRQNHSAGSGTAGMSWGYFGENGFDDETVVHLPEEGYAGTRFPFTVSGYGYHFNISTEYNTAGSEVSRMYVTVLNEDGDYIEIKVASPNGETLSGWNTQGDITFNETTGEYILGVSAENNINSDPRHFATVIGKTTDPMDPEAWVFSDWNDLSWMQEENNPNPGTGAFFRGYNTPKIQWGKDGFGVLFAFVLNELAPEEQEIMPAYLYTTDYGVTWNSDNGKFFSDFEAYRTSFNWWGTEVETPDGILPLNITVPWAVAKCVVDNNNDVHFIHALRAGASADGESYYKIYETEDQSEQVSGMYHTKLTIDTATGAGTYDHNYIATFGGVGSEAFGDFKEQYYYVNNWTMSLGMSADGVIYAGWLDRPILDDDATISPWIAGDGNLPRFIADPYFSYSEDGGKTWNNGETPEGYGGLQFGHNLLNTKDIHEEGFDLMKKTKSVADNGGELAVYGVWQEADLSQPLANPADWNDHVQDYKIAKFSAENVSDVAEIAPTSIALEQNYPNPFNPTTSINFAVEINSNVNLTVYNTAGEQVAELMNGGVNAGNHSVQFDGSNLNSGVYFYKLSVNGISTTKKMVLTK